MSPPITAPSSTKSKTSSADKRSADPNPFCPSPGHLGEIYTGTNWEPTSELDLSQRTAPTVEYTGPKEEFQPRVHISRWNQLKNTSKFSLAVMIVLVLLLIGTFTVIGLLSQDIIKVPDYNQTTTAKKNPLVNQIAILPVTTLATVPPVQTSTSSGFTQLPTIVPDVPKTGMASELLPVTVKQELTSFAAPQITSSAEFSPEQGSASVATAIEVSSVSVPKSTFVTRASIS